MGRSCCQSRSGFTEMRCGYDNKAVLVVNLNEVFPHWVEGSASRIHLHVSRQRDIGVCVCLSLEGRLRNHPCLCALGQVECYLMG